MRFIGITGGVGAGKSTVIDAVSRLTHAEVIKADELAKQMEAVGGACYEKIRKVFGAEDIWQEDLSLDNGRLSRLIYADETKRRALEQIIHPAVKAHIVDYAKQLRREGSVPYLFLEAALLIEDGYDEICDELWYVYASEPVRRARLKSSRGYTDEKISAIFASQLSEERFREKCGAVIENNGDEQWLIKQIRKLLSLGGKDMEMSGREMVFGLDIGTRNVVGIVGYKDESDKFVAVDIYAREHDTRAMLDGQIHDIVKVGATIKQVKEKLEKDLDIPLTEVCIAAAGRVLKTVTTTVETEFAEESIVTGEDIHTLDLLGVEKAQDILRETNDTKYKFYVVGYTVVKYYLNDESMVNLEGHKAEKISEDIIVTFLPWDVVDGLYAAVGLADLTVANLTLEPIAAINVAIPENFRMLNIALVDVGAGTSDICITKDGSIIAYGMIPHAGDEITELLVQHYLVDFAMAEHIKLSSTVDEEVTFEDIMSITHTIPASEVWELVKPTVDKITSEIAAKIIELNGGMSVSACFVVGGGGKVHGFTQNLAKELSLPDERVALRGEEVLKSVTFIRDEVQKDPLVVTPIGICLNYYEQRNSFIMVRFNGERIKLYDNNHLTIVDAAVAADFPNEYLFPRRGKPISFTVNGVTRMVRGTAGESAVVRMNGVEVSINTPLEANSEIEIEQSTVGEDAVYTIEKLHEFNESTISFDVNHKIITCPRFVEVNGEIVTAGYEIREGDAVEVRNYYTVRQLAEFMDVELDPDADIIVNNRVEDLDTEVYENFTVEFEVLSFRTMESDLENSGWEDAEEEAEDAEDAEEENREDLQSPIGTWIGELTPITIPSAGGEKPEPDTPESESKPEPKPNTQEPESDTQEPETDTSESESEQESDAEIPYTSSLMVYVNDEPLKLTGKTEYTFIDVFDFIDFDLSDSRGRAIVTTLNGENAVYTRTLFDGDRLVIRWEERH